MHLNKFVPDNQDADAQFGFAVAATTGELIVAGSPRRGSNDPGASFVFGPTCDADTNKDGEVSVTDLISVVMAWGSCGGCTGCFGDVIPDGEVDVDDLVEVVLHWGACVEQLAPAEFYECLERCSPTSPSCMVDCAELFELID